jgi:hypothetical protein
MNGPCRKALCFHGASPLACLTRPLVGLNLVSDAGGAACVRKQLLSLGAQTSKLLLHVGDTSYVLHPSPPFPCIFTS